MTSKRPTAEDMRNLDLRWQATNARQIDSINRLLGHRMDVDGPVNTELLYQTEMAALNSELAAMDIRVDDMAGVLRRIRQHGIDTGNDRLLDIMGGWGVRDNAPSTVDETDGTPDPS